MTARWRQIKLTPPPPPPPGLFSGNEDVPHNGNRTESDITGHPYTAADGITIAPRHVFPAIVAGTVVVAMITLLMVREIFRSSKRQARKRGSILT